MNAEQALGRILTMIVDWETCIGCGLCKEVCPLEAISIRGREMSVVSNQLHY